MFVCAGDRPSAEEVMGHLEDMLLDMEEARTYL